MQTLKLQNSDQVALIDDEFYEDLSKHTWRIANGYAVKCKGGDKLHNIILGKNPGYTVDHKNTIKLDNQKHNLRWATRKQQNQNRGPSKGRPYKGVYERRTLKGNTYFIAVISEGGIQTNLGRFETAEKAAMVYDTAAKILHKEFAFSNFSADTQPEENICNNFCETQTTLLDLTMLEDEDD
jgi:hypothetical protein